MKMEQIECSETSAYKIQTPGNHPEENIQQTEKCCTAGQAADDNIERRMRIACCTPTATNNQTSSPGFDLMPICVGFVTDGMKLVKMFLWVLYPSAVSIFPLMFHRHIFVYLSVALYYPSNSQRR
jgi:hypothetical protein